MPSRKRSRRRQSRRRQSRRRQSRRRQSRRRSRKRSRSPSNKVYLLKKSPRAGKKWRVTLPSGKNVDFGATGYSDYTLHKDKERYERYKKRHRSREKWGKSGIATAGFWARWILWNKPSLVGSIRDTQKRFNIRIRRKRTV